MQASYAKKRTGRVQKRQRKTRGAKKDTVLQRLRRSRYRCAGAQTSRNKRVLEIRRKSSSTDLLRLEGKKTMLFIESGIRVRSEKKEKKERGKSTKTKRISQKKDFEDLPRDRALKFLLKQVMLRVTLFHRKICDPLDSHDQVSLIDYASLGYSISTYSMWEGLVEGLARQPKTKGEIKRTNSTEL